MSEPDTLAASARELPPLKRKSAALAVAVGTLLFCIGALELKFGASVPLTPLFILPLAVVLVRQRQIGWPVVILLAVVTTAAHEIAQSVAMGIVSPLMDGCPETGATRAPYAICHALGSAQLSVPAWGGLAAGAAGAAVSFAALLLLGARFRTRARFETMVLGALGLGAVGAFGLAASLGFSPLASSGDPSLAFVLFLYIPWQLAFGGVLIALFDDRLMDRRTRRRAKSPPSPSRAA